MYLIADIAVDTEKRNFRKNDAFLAHGKKIVFWAFFTSERNEMKPFPAVSDAELYFSHLGHNQRGILLHAPCLYMRLFKKSDDSEVLSSNEGIYLQMSDARPQQCIFPPLSHRYCEAPERLFSFFSPH